VVTERLSQDDDDTAARVYEVCDNSTSVENGELGDDTAYVRLVVDDGVEAHYNTSRLTRSHDVGRADGKNT